MSIFDEPESREEEARRQARREMGLPDMGFYDRLRYCGTCPGGPLLYGDGTCPVCGNKNGVRFEDTKPKEQ